MSGNLSGFDANTVDPSRGYDPLPAGWYEACIVDSDLKRTKAGNGMYFAVEFQVVSGPFLNRKIWTNINYENPNPIAKQIGRAQLSAICRAVGVLTPNDFNQLHNKTMRVKVVVKKSDEYGDGNEIKAYEQRDAGPAQQATRQGNGSPWPASTQDPSPAYQDTARQAESVF